MSTDKVNMAPFLILEDYLTTIKGSVAIAETQPHPWASHLLLVQPCAKQGRPLWLPLYRLPRWLHQLLSVSKGLWTGETDHSRIFYIFLFPTPSLLMKIFNCSYFSFCEQGKQEPTIKYQTKHKRAKTFNLSKTIELKPKVCMERRGKAMWRPTRDVNLRRNVEPGGSDTHL